MRILSVGDPTYFNLQVIGGGFISEYDMGYGPGVYAGYCIDVDHGIYLNQDYDAYLYSSYDLPEWLVPDFIEYPDNLDKINYLVNRFELGQEVQLKDGDCNSFGTPEALTYGDIQMAIWHYMDDNQETSGLGDWSQQRVNAILCYVEDNFWEGYRPGCDEKIVFLVVPTEEQESFNIQIVIGQPVIASIPVPCEDIEGTAWGDGYFGATFPGSMQWGTWFEYDSDCVPLP